MTTKYFDKLKDPRWQKKRLEIFKRDKFKCKYCGDTKTTLHVHHKSYKSGNPWDVDNSELITVCEHCHYEIEENKSSGYKYSITKILKLNNWNDDVRIMFCVIADKCVMKIYKNKDMLIGFQFENDITEIIKILNSAKNGKTS